MKILSTILAILVLFLSVQPACGVPVVQQAGENACIENCCAADEQDFDGASDEDEDCKSCNPFQSCSCCVGSTLATQQFRLSKPSMAVENPAYVDMVVSFPAATDGDFWQPPRVI